MKNYKFLHSHQILETRTVQPHDGSLIAAGTAVDWSRKVSNIVIIGPERKKEWGKKMKPLFS